MTQEELDDRDLLTAHLAGDPLAFTRIVQRHQGKLWSVALRTLRDPDAASDAVQDALLSAYRNAGTYRGESAVGTWLYRIVVNACLSRLRREKARPADPLPDHDLPAPTDEHQRLVDRLALDQALARLPEPQRTAIVLVDLQELPVAEVAEILGVPAGTIKSRCSRGRAALAGLLTEPAPTPGNRTPGPGVPMGGTPPTRGRIEQGGPP